MSLAKNRFLKDLTNLPTTQSTVQPRLPDPTLSQALGTGLGAYAIYNMMQTERLMDKTLLRPMFRKRYLEGFRAKPYKKEVLFKTLKNFRLVVF